MPLRCDSLRSIYAFDFSSSKSLNLWITFLARRPKRANQALQFTIAISLLSSY